MIYIGLTGSIGMGKTTVAQMFEDLGAAVFDADVAVHTLYKKGGAAVPLLRAVFSEVIENGAVVRAKLAKHLQADPLQLQVLESFIHPMVQDLRYQAIELAKAKNKKIMIFDVPLLFETGGETKMDKIIVVSADIKTQTKRVLSRPGMTAKKFEFILSRQMPDKEKRARADYVIWTDKGLDFARQEVQNIMGDLLVGEARSLL